MIAALTKFLAILFFVGGCVAICVDYKYYPRYHLAPQYGWMNDPNGFCIFKDEYHLFFQFNPNSSQEPGIAHWGHAKSSDLMKWEYLPIAMYPDKVYDKTGVFSGSALVDNDTMLIMYTGNVNHPDETPDHIQRQATASSTDGIQVTKYSGNPVIMGDKYQPNIRDPKLWKHENRYYAVLGNSFQNNSMGRALLFSSTDFHSGWKLESVLDESDGSLGYMWECPDFFELNGMWVLLFSPQGIKPQGNKYLNKYQAGHILGLFDYETKIFTPKSEFKEMDHGHDFYATQTTVDKSGRRIMVAWMDMWDQDYPERDDGWTGQMTLPRELQLTADNNLIQIPLKEASHARENKLYSGSAKDFTSVELQDNTGEINIRAPLLHDYEIIIESINQTLTISYDFKRGRVTLDRGGDDGTRITKWRPRGLSFKWRIFVDASSVELFCGDGEVTFSSRFFPGGKVTVRLGDNVTSGEVTIHSMKRTVPKPECDNSSD